MTHPRILSFVALFCLSISLGAQIQPGMVQIDDMILPESVLSGDGAFTATPWPAGQVPYQFHQNVSLANQSLTLAAMAEIEAVCNVDFFPRGSETNYILVVDSTENSSPVGMITGAQELRIVSWSVRHIIVHELLHALGQIHEHQRLDRDTFVVINTNNVGNMCGTGNNQSCTHNFTRIDTGVTVGPYDFLSLMHYGQTAFSSNGQATITCQPTYASFQSQMGQRQYLSVQDALTLQARYGYPAPPSCDLITPTNLSPGAPGFVLNVYGSRFLAGSTVVGAGVQGTRILWNGLPIQTTYISSTQVQANITASLVAAPGEITIRVENPLPGGGISISSRTLSVGCGNASALTLNPGAVQSTNSNCTAFGVNPGPAWNVIAAGSDTGNWALSIGSGNSNIGGLSTEFVGANGFRWGVSPGFYQMPGSASLQSGAGAGTLEMVTSTGLTTGQSAIGAVPAGSLVRAFHFTGGPGLFRVESSGGTGLSWVVLSDLYANPGWRGRSDIVAAGTVGGSPVGSLSLPLGFSGPENYCLIVYRNVGPAPTTQPFTITVCLDTAPTVLTTSPTNLIGTQGFCLPFTFLPHINRWNAVGVSSASDYDIAIDNVTSQLGSSACDYVLYNGHFQQPQPTLGTISRFSGFQNADAMHATTTLVNLPGSANAASRLLHVFEFAPNQMGNYDLSITAPAGFTWDFHEAGLSGAWRNRSSRQSGGYPANGAPVRIQMGGGMHAVVVARSGGAETGALPLIQFQSSLSAVQPPSALSLSPSAMPALSPTFTLTVLGSDFSPSSIVRWEGQGVPTTWISSTELEATIDSVLLSTPRSLFVDVVDSTSGTSGPLFFNVGNPIPHISSMTPSYAIAGSPGLGIVLVGTGFLPSTVIQFDGINLASTMVGPSEIHAVISQNQLATNGTAFVWATNPFAPVSNTIPFIIDNPFLWTVAPSMVPIGYATPTLLTLTGANFVPGCAVYIDGIALPTTYVSEIQLEATWDPNLFTSVQQMGGLGVNVANTLTAVSNPQWISVGGGENRGAVRLEPLDTSPGAPFRLYFEEYEGLFGQPVSLIVDLGSPVPVGSWPDATANMVLGVLAGSSGPLLSLRDGLGLLGVPDGSALSSLTYGGWVESPPLLMPPTPLGVAAYVQAAYLDPSSPVGFRLSWTRRVDL
jgi:hypothetical protein